MYALNKAVVFLLLGSSVYTEYKVCTKEKARAGLMACVRMRPYYDAYQWAMCVSSTVLRRQTNGKHICRGSYCWFPCMKATTGRSTTVSSLCRCDPKSALSPTYSKIDTSCYILSTRDCSWYRRCLEKFVSITCGMTSYQQVFKLEYKRCQLYHRIWNTFSGRARKYLSKTEDCLQKAMYASILPDNKFTCASQRQKLLDAHEQCSEKSSSISFCSLKPVDQLRLYWISKDFLKMAFDDFCGDTPSRLTKCQSEYRPTKAYRIKAKFKFKDIINNPSAPANKIAKRTKWKDKGIIWESAISHNVSNTLELRVSYDPKYSFTQNQTSYVRINLERDEEDVNMGSSTTTVRSFGELSLMQFVIASRRRISYVTLGAWTAILVIDFPDRSQKTKFDVKMPDTLQEIGLSFLLFTRSIASGNGQLLDHRNAETVDKSSFNSNVKTVFIVHGFRNSGNTSWVQKVKRELLRKEDINIIIVDWKKGAAAPLQRYPRATVNTAVVGYATSILINLLCQQFNATISDMHIIGHSLGAHIAGFAGYYTGGRIGRISGLDPAGIYFEKERKEIRLDASDAYFVDVIHTDGGGSFSMGINTPSGDVDFYPNGGEIQPGCFWPINWNVACSHERATLLFIESIRSDCKFMACQCSEKDYKENKCSNLTCTDMGYQMDLQAKHGIYYLDTNLESEYCTGKLPGQRRRKKR